MPAGCGADILLGPSATQLLLDTGGSYYKLLGMTSVHSNRHTWSAVTAIGCFALAKHWKFRVKGAVSASIE